MISVLTDAVNRSVGQGAAMLKGREALRAAGARTHRAALPGVRGHRPGSVVRGQVFSVLSDVPDRRQGAGRPAHVTAAQVADRPGLDACRYAARMTRQKILITGASSGLGAGMARSFAAKGRDLALCARRTDRLDELKAELSQQYPAINDRGRRAGRQGPRAGAEGLRRTQR